jgi:type III pantothenate kinase
MNLTIDSGNTFTKAGIFDEGRLVSFMNNIMEQDFEAIAKKYKPKNLIISSVSKNHEAFSNFFPTIKKMIYLDHTTKLPIKNLYDSPETLGSDRIAAAVGSTVIFPEKDRLTIDAGTCITFDITDKKDNYLGGSISPGIEMRFKALNTFTSRLPLVERKEKADLIGENTNEALLSGVINGTVAEIEGIIRAYKDMFPGIKIIICGGDAAFFESKIKETIFAVPQLVMIGLNRILEYNVSEV